MDGNEIKKNRYMPGLDGIRALAVFVVIAYHLDFEWVSGGFLGVGVFFVLSGYLITDLLILEWANTGQINLRHFWIKRAKRLLPGQILVLIVVALWLLLFNFSRLDILWGDLLASIFYVTNWWFIFNDVGYFSNFGEPSPLLHFWSLAIEEQFYLFWPFLLLLGLRFVHNRKLFIGFILVGTLASALGMAYLYQPGLMDTSRVYFGTDTRAFALLIGAALALCFPSKMFEGNVANNKYLRISLDIVGGISCAILFWMIWQTNQYEAFLYRGGMVLQCITSAVVVAAAVHPSTWITRILGCRLLQWLGVRSYGIYIWHYPVLVLFFPLSGGENSIPHILIQIGITLLVASISWRFIEQPIRYGEVGSMFRGIWRFGSKECSTTKK
ncbi:acyltransferase family protein [Lysinibacillus cavernae]|uniref:acyltransferase family protein n=1 Tax=Lysinibacillus cavernae TaxID=2666135 RepID=UPI0018C2F37E|nr:acyltransferase [Lysinibacillus cavernae]